MLKKIKKVIGAYLKKENLYQSSIISDKKLKTLPHTIRTKVDQDDAWFFALVQNNAKVFDLGCNVGYTSLIAGIQEKNTDILLVDPNPEALAKASQNMIINGFGIKCKFISAFVGEEDGEKINFYTVGSGAAGSMFSSHAETATALNSFYEVEKITIDTLIKKVGYIPDLIKIDVEGAETLALLGAKQTAKEQKVKFFIEMHSPKELPMKENAQLILDWCSDNHYRAFYLKEMVELDTSEMIAHRGKCHLLIVPKNDSLPEYLKNIKERSPLPKTI